MPNTSRTPHPIVNTSSRIIGVLAGCPKDPTWEGAHRGALEEILASRGRCSFPPKAKHHRRGKFPALSWGISHRGGQRVRVKLFNAQQAFMHPTRSQEISTMALRMPKCSQTSPLMNMCAESQGMQARHLHCGLRSSTPTMKHTCRSSSSTTPPFATTSQTAFGCHSQLTLAHKPSAAAIVTLPTFPLGDVALLHLETSTQCKVGTWSFGTSRLLSNFPQDPQS